MFYFDDKLLVVGNFNKILSLTSEEICFDFKRYQLVINGNNLLMPYLEDKEVGIKGVINNISIKYKMVNENVQ